MRRSAARSSSPGSADPGWTRQLRVTPLPPVAYIAGKLLVSYIVTVPAIAAVLLAGVAVDHVTMSITEWLLLLGALAIGALPFAALGLLIGYLFDGNSAQGATMISLFGLAILGGLWAPISSFPDDLATIGRMLPSFRLADIGRDAANGLLPDGIDIAILALYAVVIGGLAVWRYRSSEQRTEWLTTGRARERAPAVGPDPLTDPLVGLGSWLPAWRIIGAIFVAYPVVRIIAAPPEPIVAVLALSATAIFALLIGVLARRGPLDDATRIDRPSRRSTSRSSASRLRRRRAPG